jgi:soluble lytic murein transglycosylase
MGLQADKGVTALIEAVPEALKGDPGLAYDRFIWRMRRDNYDEAVELMLERSPPAAGPPRGLGRPARAAGALADAQGPDGRGLPVAAPPSAWPGGRQAYADLEFLAGFIALRKLGDPVTALRISGHLKAGVTTPISVARAEILAGPRGRGHAGRKDEAAKHYQGRRPPPDRLLRADWRPNGWACRWTRPCWRQPGRRLAAGFAGSSVLEAARCCWRATARWPSGSSCIWPKARTRRGWRSWPTWPAGWGEPHIAVLVGQGRRPSAGVILPRAYYPVPDMVPDGLAVSRALALAITRRESEFDPAARSACRCARA